MIDDIVNIRRAVEYDVFDYQTLTSTLTGYSKPRDKITKLLESGTVVRIKKGLYCFSEDFRKEALSREYIANLVYGPSYISLEYALSYHGLIPERVNTLTSVTTRRTREFDTPVGVFTYQMLTGARYSTGADLFQTGKVSFLMASPEKALIDKVQKDRRLGSLPVSDYKTYLLEDLRIDSHKLTELDIPSLKVISSRYNSMKIDNLVCSIENLRSGVHA